MPRPATTVTLTDPRALRAYAHPTRMALIGLLRRHGPQTATEAAAAIGESVASCSFHLRQLARFGLIEQVEGDHGRAKPWRATAMSTSWRSDSADPELAAAATALDAAILDRYYAQARAWLDRRGQEPAAWRRAPFGGDWLLHLTAAELRRLGERLEALTAEFRPRNLDPAQRPRGSRPVSLIALGFPDADPPLGPAPPATVPPPARPARDAATVQPTPARPARDPATVQPTPARPARDPAAVQPAPPKPGLKPATKAGAALGSAEGEADR